MPEERPRGEIPATPLGWMARIMREAASVCLLVMAAVTLVDVVGRGMGKPLFGSEEISAFMAALVVALSLPYAHMQRSHIGVEIFMRFLPRTARRRMALATTSVSTLLFAIVTWRMVVYALTLRASGVVSMNLEFPEYVVVLLVAGGFAAFTLCLASDAVRLARGGGED